MASYRQYAGQLWTTQKAVALRLGSDLSTADKRTRIVMQSLLAVVAIVVKALVDKGVLTDQELANARNAVLNETWPEETDDPR